MDTQGEDRRGAAITIAARLSPLIHIPDPDILYYILYYPIVYWQ